MGRSFSDNTSAISTVDPDVIETHILTRLDGWSLASIACVSSQLNSLVAANNTSLWTNICHSTWPSTNTPRLHQLIHGNPRSFFSNSSSTPDPTTTTAAIVNHHHLPSELISAVDVYYRSQLMLSKVVETETVSSWYRCSPFRVNLIDSKDKIPTRISYPETEEACRELAENITLSWILIDPTEGRAVNLSSQKPVSVQRHWLTGEIKVCFASVMGGQEQEQEQEQCCVFVSFGGMEMHVREVSLQVEDVDGMHLNGKDSLVILQRALEGKRENLRGREEGIVKRRYEDYLEIRRVRKEKKLKREGTLDLLCVLVGVFTFTSLLLFAFSR